MSSAPIDPAAGREQAYRRALQAVMGRRRGRFLVVVALNALIAVLLTLVGYRGLGLWPNFLACQIIGLAALAAGEAGWRSLPRRWLGRGLALALPAGILAGVALAAGVLGGLGLIELPQPREFPEIVLVAAVYGVFAASFMGLGTWLSISDDRLAREQAALAQLQRAQARIQRSLAYAERLQRAALPTAEPGELGLSDLAIWWEPRDEVGGDVYCCVRRGNETAILLMDCTGHGVPGALIGFAALDVAERLLHQARRWEPARLLAQLDERVRAGLHRDRSRRGEDDGLEAGLAIVDTAEGRLRYAGVGVHLVAVGPDGAETYRCARGGIGYRDNAFPKKLETQRGSAAGQTFWLASDGLLEQPGGEKGLQLGRKGFVRLAEAASSSPDLMMAMAALQMRFATWQGDIYRRDDTTAIAFRV